MVLAAGLAGCGDFSNRTYTYGDDIPVKPLVVKLVQTDAFVLRDRIGVVAQVIVTNSGVTSNRVERGSFELRVGSAEWAETAAAMERTGKVPAATGPRDLNGFSLGPDESSPVKLSFMVAREDLNQSLALIVDRRTRKGRETLSLVRLKDATPLTEVMESGWSRTFVSPKWK